MSVTGFNRRRRELAAKQRQTKQERLPETEGQPNLEELTIKDLRIMAKEIGVVGYGNMSKADIISAIQSAENAAE